jgi:hypothetical protein
VLVVLESIPYLDLVGQITLDLLLKFLREWIFTKHPSEHSEFPLKLLAAFAHGGDNASDFADVVREDD